MANKGIEDRNEAYIWNPECAQEPSSRAKDGAPTPRPWIRCSNASARPPKARENIESPPGVSQIRTPPGPQRPMRRPHPEHLNSAMHKTSPSTGQRALGHPDRIPPLDEVSGRYRLRFARSQEDLDEVQRLRFDVFHLELGEGLEVNRTTGRDKDRFDDQCQHLMVLDLVTGICVGTYRMQTPTAAAEGHGFYSAQEFALEDLPDDFLGQSIELGRACIAKEHRDQRVLFLLWRGLRAYADHAGLKALFGCSSLTSQDPAQGLRFHEMLTQRGHLQGTLFAKPREDYLCRASAAEVANCSEPKIPKLFKIYLRHGATVIGGPALDREFGTIDTLIHVHIDEDRHRQFSARERRPKV